MRIPRLYCPLLTHGLQELSAEESRHAIASLRLAGGDAVELFDGTGRVAPAIIDRMECRRIWVQAANPTGPHDPDVRLQLTLAVAMPKGPRQGFLVEKCTELGVHAVWLLDTKHGVARAEHETVNKLSRRAIEACKQSRRRWLPNIAGPFSIDDVLARANDFTSTSVGDLHEHALPLVDWLARIPGDGTILLLIGPEGGWADEERGRIHAAGVASVTLGPTVLRTETAAIAACAAVAGRSPAW